MGELSRLGRRQKEILAKGVIAGILCQLAAAAAQYVMWGSPMAQSVREILRQPVQKALDQGEITRHGAELLAQSYEMMLKAMPSIIFLWTVIVVLLIYYIGCGILIRRGMAIENYEPFILFSFSRQLVFGSFVLYACAWVSDLLGIGDGQVLYLNLLIILWFLFALQGTAVTAFLCRRMRFPAVLSALFLGILLISMIGTIILFIVGLLDIFARFRDRSSRDKE